MRCSVHTRTVTIQAGDPPKSIILRCRPHPKFSQTLPETSQKPSKPVVVDFRLSSANVLTARETAKHGKEEEERGSRKDSMGIGCPDMALRHQEASKAERAQSEKAKLQQRRLRTLRSRQ